MTGITRQEVLDLLWEEPVKIGQWCGFTDLTELHNGWLRDFLWKEGEDQTLLSHRGSYKTTVDSIAIAVYMIIHPDRNILFFRKNYISQRRARARSARISPQAQKGAASSRASE